MTIESDVRAASASFYAALNRMANGDATAMEGSWLHDTSVTAMHPVGGRDIGWDKVGGSFRQIAEICSDGQITLEDQLIRAEGDFAYEIGSERGQFKLAGHRIDLDHRVTNIYRRQGGVWRLVHHHADLSPAMLDALDRVKSSD